MTGSPQGLPTRRDTGTDERHTPNPLDQQERPRIFPAAHIVRRTAPASRPWRPLRGRAPREP